MLNPRILSYDPIRLCRISILDIVIESTLKDAYHLGLMIFSPVRTGESWRRYRDNTSSEGIR